MSSPSHTFLESVLGAPGASALFRAAEKSAEIQNALLPRSVLAWIKASNSHDGELPGLPGSYASFSKSETGFDGEVVIGEELYKFEGASLWHVAASVAVALSGGQPAVNVAGLTAHDAERLGHSIDLLAKRQLLTQLLAKNSEETEKAETSESHVHSSEGPPPGYKGPMCVGCMKLADKKRKTTKLDGTVKKEELEKAGSGPGKAAGPIAPSAPAAPTAKAPPPVTKPLAVKPPVTGAAKKPDATPKPAGIKPLKMSLSEASHACGLCGNTQFTDGKFTGCSCLSALAKSARVTVADADGFTIQLSRDWDADALLALLECVGRV